MTNKKLSLINNEERPMQSKKRALALASVLVFQAWTGSTLSAKAQDVPNLPAITLPFTSEVVVDLGEVQTTLQNMLNGIRQDSRCDANWNVWDAHVIPNGASVKVDFMARYFLNKCVIETVPEWHGLFHMEMHDHVIGETILFSQAGHIAVDVTPAIKNGVIKVDTNVVTADMDGLLGRLKLNGQVKSFLNDKIRDALQAKLTTALPPAIVKAGVQFSEVAFVDLGGGKLGLKVKAAGKMTS
jgi:hypothetical protein